MEARTALLPLLPIVLSCLSCGRTSGRTSGAVLDASADVSDGQSSADEAGDSSDDDADAAGAGAAPSTTCAVTGWSASVGVRPCERTATEVCDDGNEYTVSCSCPAAMCTCASGSDGGRIFASAPYGACPTCADAGMGSLFVACGLP